LKVCILRIAVEALTDIVGLVGAFFNNWLDAVDGSFCKFKGGDDPAYVSRKAYFNPLFYSSLCSCRMAFTPTLDLGVIIVRPRQDATTLILIVI
jgi:hypothetical protein